MKKLPTKFEQLPVAELRRSAVEDFAVEVNKGDTAEVIIAGLVEAGVEWSDYVKQHPEVLPEEEAPSEENKTAAHASSEDDPVQPEEQKYLIKMVRENPLFQAAGHTFTDVHPYALVNSETAEYLLTKEEGFRQATPSEVTEFYS